MIIAKTYELLHLKYGSRIKDLLIEDIRIGTFMSAVKLSDQSYGLASTLFDEDTYCGKKNRDFSAFTPGNIKGQKVTDLFETEKKSGLIDTLKTAVLNAISAKILEEGHYRIIQNADPVDLIDLQPPKVITIVGAFQSYIEKLSATENTLHVLELNESALLDHQKKFFVPASQYEIVVPVSDVVIITGLTLVNNTIDDLLAAISPGTQVVITGPSSSLVPDVLFDHKVTAIGATRITHPELLFDVVGSGGKGYHLFRYCAEKISILPG
ncbi:MAG: DUF364 domain-containing protein [Saprospiraceae bacterium]|nr:DUF364 domain-containing protein [Saprospiraceae bacterium]